MIKLGANLSKKVPLPGVDYSSQQFGASMELEVSDKAGAVEISERLAEMYGQLETAIKEQIGSEPASSHPERENRPSGNGSNRRNGSNGNGRSRSNGSGKPASAAQIKAIFAITRDQGMDRRDLLDLVGREYGAARIDDLTVAEASELIKQLQQLEEAR